MILYKNELRKAILGERNNFSKEYITEASKKIFQNIEALDVFKKAKSIFIYLNFGSEIQTIDFIKKHLNDKEIYLPKILEDEMKLIKITSLNRLKESSFGVLEPISNEIYSGKVDLVITPSITFDEKGFRIGYGKGYYDKYFALKKYSYSIGVCYSRLLQRSLPIESHDISVDLVITD